MGAFSSYTTLECAENRNPIARFVSFNSIDWNSKFSGDKLFLWLIRTLFSAFQWSAKLITPPSFIFVIRNVYWKGTVDFRKFKIWTLGWEFNMILISCDSNIISFYIFVYTR